MMMMTEKSEGHAQARLAVQHFQCGRAQAQARAESK